MSTWKPDSDLMRLNAAPPDVWVDVPERLMAVLDAALEIGRASGGAFDIGVGDAVAAWGFGPAAASRTAFARRWRPQAARRMRRWNSMRRRAARASMRR